MYFDEGVVEHEHRILLESRRDTILRSLASKVKVQIEKRVKKNTLVKKLNGIDFSLPSEVFATQEKFSLRAVDDPSPSPMSKREKRNYGASMQTTFTLRTPEGPLTVEGLSEPIILCCPKAAPTKPPKDAPSKDKPPYSCRYYVEATDTWSSDGCEFSYQTMTEICCACTHLTKFAMLPIRENLSNIPTLESLNQLAADAKAAALAEEAATYAPIADISILGANPKIPEGISLSTAYKVNVAYEKTQIMMRKKLTIPLY